MVVIVLSAIKVCAACTINACGATEQLKDNCERKFHNVVLLTVINQQNIQMVYAILTGIVNNAMDILTPYMLRKVKEYERQMHILKQQIHLLESKTTYIEY